MWETNHIIFSKEPLCVGNRFQLQLCHFQLSNQFTTHIAAEICYKHTHTQGNWKAGVHHSFIAHYHKLSCLCMGIEDCKSLWTFPNLTKDCVAFLTLLVLDFISCLMPLSLLFSFHISLFHCIFSMCYIMHSTLISLNLKKHQYLNETIEERKKNPQNISLGMIN